MSNSWNRFESPNIVFMATRDGKYRVGEKDAVFRRGLGSSKEQE